MEAKELYNVYETWCFRSGERALGNRSFYRMLETKGFGKTKGTGNKTFLQELPYLNVNQLLKELLKTQKIAILRLFTNCFEL